MRISYIIKNIYIMEDTVICKVQINYWGFSHKEPDLTNLKINVGNGLCWRLKHGIYVGETEIKPTDIDMVLPFAKYVLGAIYRWLVSGLVSSMIVEILARLFRW